MRLSGTAMTSSEGRIVMEFQKTNESLASFALSSVKVWDRSRYSGGPRDKGRTRGPENGGRKAGSVTIFSFSSLNHLELSLILENYL